MAGTISFSGLSASGLDTSSWVDALVSVKQQTITSLEQQKAEKENLLSIVNNIKSYFSSFQTCLQKITDSQYGIASMDLFMQNLALSSNSSIATATATTEAARQSYDVAVDSLATATKATSGYSQIEVKTADLNTTFGTLGGKNGTITVNSQSFNVTTEDTLQNLIDKFKNVGVDAKFDENKGTFTIGMDLDKIDEGATNLKNALRLANNNVSGAVSGSVVYANRNTEFYKLGLNGGDINIEGVKHTITKNGNDYTIQKDGGAAVQMNTLGEFLDYLKSSAVGADDATVDTKGHITIKGATLDKVEGGTNLIDVLNLIESQKRTVSESGALSYIEVRVADLNTKLSALGITGDTTLVAGGTNNTISNDKTLGDIKNILKNAGVDMSVDSRGIITIDTHGNEISGTLLDVLNLDPTKGGTTISSSAHQATLKADGNTKLSELGISSDKKYTAYKSDGTALTTEISNVEGQTVDEFVNALKNSGLDAKFDEKTHQITIKDGYIEGSLADALGMTQLSTSFTENASLNTQLEKLGATGDSTLTIDGGTAKTYGKDTTLETVFNDIKNAGGKVTFKDGNVTIEGVTLGGSLPSLLGLDATTQGTSVTSGKLTAVTGSTSSGGNTESTVEHNIELSTKLGDITGTTSNYTLKVGDGASTTYTKDSTLQDIKTQIEGAGGKFTINDDNTISIEGVTMSGTVVGALGFDELATGTKFTTVDAVMISGTSNVATGDTTLGNLGLVASGSTSGARAVRRAPEAFPNKTLSINGGAAKTYGADVSLDDIFADIVAAGGTASINSEGYIVIDGVHLEGTLVDALGLVETSYKTTITSGDLKVTTSTKSTSSSALYTDTKGDIAWDSTIGSIVGDTNSYDLKVNGTNKTYNTNTKLSDIKNVIQAAGGTMTINDDNTISINGVEISGSLVDKLGFNSDGVHTVVSSNNPIYYTDGKKSADTGTTFEQLGIGADKRDYAIYKNDGTEVKASSTDGTNSGKTIGDWLKVVNDSLNTANGTSDITYASINNGVISITGGYVTDSLPTELGIGTKETVTGITMEGSSVSYVEYDPLKYIGNTQTGSGIAAGTMVTSGFMTEAMQYKDELGNIHAVTETTKLSEVLDSGPTVTSRSYTLNVGNYTKTFDIGSTTLGDIVNYVNNLNMDTTHDTTTSATLVDGKLTIESNVSITGTLLGKLGFEKQDVSSVAYEIKGTQKAHYKKNDGVTVTASGFSTAVTTQSTSGADKVYVSSLSDFVSGSTYYVKSASDLNKLAELTNAGKNTSGVTFVLENDVDLAGQQFVPIGTYNNSFKGNFYGNGHVIKNLTITDTSVLSDPNTGGRTKVYCAGLFGVIDGAKLYDIGLENVNINLSIDGDDSVDAGALAGVTGLSSEINNCYSTGSVSTDGYAGGLVFDVASSSVSNSYSTVNVSGNIVGGLVAYLFGGKISNSFATGNVDGTTAGGLVGDGRGITISNSFATGNANGTTAGGLVGIGISGKIKISDSFATGNVTGAESQGGVVAITSATSTTTTVTNCGYSGSTGLDSGVSSGATAMTDAQLKSSIEGLGISSATVVNKTVDTTATTSTTIKELMGKGGEQAFNFYELNNPMSVSRRIAFAETDTIQTVIDKLKEFGFDEVDLVDGIFRIKDDKKWAFYGSSELVNKLFGGDDRTYGAEGPQVTYQVTHSSIGSYTGNKITYTTTTTGSAGSVTGNQLTYTTTTGSAGSVTGNKLTYTTTTTTTTSGKTYSGDVVKTIAKGYSTGTKLVDINSDYKGKKCIINFPKDGSTSGSTGTGLNSGSGNELGGSSNNTSTKPSGSVGTTVGGSTGSNNILLQQATLTINENTTIQDVLSFYSSNNNSASYDKTTGDISINYKDGYSGTNPFNGGNIGQIASQTATTSTTLGELTSNLLLEKINVFNNGSEYSLTVTSSKTIQDVLDFFNNTAGCTATFTDGKLTVTGASDLEFRKAASGRTYDMSTLFGGNMPTSTPSIITTTHTATGSTKMSELGVTDFTVNGSALSGITGDSTINDVLAKLKSTYGLSEATISDGKVTLKSNSNITLSGNLIKGLMGQDSVSITPTAGTTTTTKTYTGTKVTYGATPATGHTTDTKLSTIRSSWVGQRIYVKSSEYTGSTTGYPGNSVLFHYMDITNTTTIDDVINFFDGSAGVTRVTYDQTSGELELQLNVDYSVSTPFDVVNDELIGPGQLGKIKYDFGQTGGSRGSTMTASTTLNDLLVMTAAANTITVTNNGTTTSFDISQSTNLLGIISNLQSVGCTATITDGVLTVTGGEDLEFGGNTTVWESIFGGSIPTPTTSTTGSTGGGSTGGTTTTHTATGTTKMSELGIIDFTVNGSVLSGITSSSTVDDVLAKLKSTYGLSEATISDGKITLKSNSNITLSGNLIKGLMGQDSVSITASSVTTPASQTGNMVTYTKSTTTNTGYKYTAADYNSGSVYHAMMKDFRLVSFTDTNTTYNSPQGQMLTGRTITGVDKDGLSFSIVIEDNTTLELFDNQLYGYGFRLTQVDAGMWGIAKADTDSSGTIDIGDLAYQGSYDAAKYVAVIGKVVLEESGVPYTSTTKYTADSSTTMSDLGLSPTLKVDGKDITGLSSSSTVGEVLSALKSQYGIDGSISDGKMTLTSSSSHTVSGDVINKFFGSDSISLTPTTSGGGSSTHTATGTTKMSELGITDFTVNGSALSGITNDSTVDDVLSKLKSTYGLSEATISDGKVTLKSNSNITLSGNLIKGLMGQDSVSITPTAGTTTTTKTYTGTKVTYGATPATGHTTDTKLSTIRSSWVGQRIYVKSSEYTGSTTGYPGNSVLFHYMDITNTTTIDDVINFFDGSAGVTKVTYDQTSGELELKLNVDYSVSAPFICTNDTRSFFGSTVIYDFGQTGGSSGSPMTASTTLNDLLVMTAATNTITVTNNGTTTSFDISQSTNLLGIISNLQSVGCTATITDGVLTVTGGEDLEFGGNTTVWESIFGGSIPTPTTSTTGSTGGGSTGGTTTTQTADTTTKLGASGLGLTSFDLQIEPLGDAEPISISGLNGDSTIGDVFKKLAEKGITASMNNGVITLTSNTEYSLSGTIAKKLFGNDIVELECTDEIHNFDMTQVSGTKYQYVSRNLTAYSGSERVSEVSQLVAGNKYHISSAEDLVALANFVKNGADTTGSIFMFDNDIDMSGVTGFEGIGTNTNAFKGTVYGNGHVVNNMTIDAASSPFMGLFGYTNQATIKDIGVINANVTGGAYTGILVGKAENSQISNAYTSGTVISDSDQIGGLAGEIKNSTATNVYSTADVKGNGNVGGLVGISSGSVIEKAFATGKATATTYQAGGLIGAMINGGTVKNSYATGDVNGVYYDGGFVGLIEKASISYTFDTVYSTGRVNGSDASGGFVGFVNTGATVNIKNAVYNRSTGVDAIGLKAGTITGNISGKDYEQMIQKSVMQNAGFTEDKGWVYSANSTPIFGNTTVTGGGKTYLDSSITSLTSGSTYYISTLEQLNNLATLVNSGADTSGVNFVLDNDIDVSSFTHIIMDFEGTFYGNGHSLTGLKTALFSTVGGNAIVRDLALENMSESGILANNVTDNSTVDNVYSTGSTNSRAGLIDTLEGNATLKNSYSTANVTTTAGFVGGLVGLMSDNTTIENCFAKNTIKQTCAMSMNNHAGGLVGRASGGTIKSSYADCNINVVKSSSVNTTAGGLIGGVSGNVTIENCYATGSRTADKTGMFIGQNDGNVTSSGNVACTGSSISGTPSGFSDGVTFVSNAELNSQARMEELGFTKDKGWVYYTGKAPMLQGKDTSSVGTEHQIDTKSTLDSICKNRENKTLTVTINGETHSKTFKGSDTVGDVANWLNGIDGVTANVSNSKFNVSGASQDFRVDGELADVLFGNNKTITNQTITENTDSNGLMVDGGQKKIDNNTTVGQLLGVTSGKYAITYIDDSGNLQSEKFSSDEKLSEVLKYLNNNGFQASIVNGVFTATKDGKIATNISGAIGEKLKGENGTVTNTSSGYKTGQLDASSSTKATATTKLSDLGIASGSIFIKDNNNNTLGTIQIDNSMTIDDTAQLLANYGFTLGITDGKVTIEGNGTNRIADGTSNLVSQMKLNNWIETKDKLKTDSTVAQMGFGKGSTLGLVLDNKTYNLTFDANATLQDIIDTLGTYGVTASVDNNGKFMASASGNLVLTNELGAYLTKNSAEGYVKEADGYKSKDPLEFKGDKVKLDYDSKVGDILGNGKDGVLRLTLNKDTVVDLTYKADDTMADIIADLKGYGITATIDDGVLNATSNDKTFRLSGEIGKIISGDTPQYDDISTGYVSKDLSYETTNKTNMNNTLKEMGVSSGQIHVLSNDGKIVSTLDIDNSYTVAQVKSLLQPFGMTLSVDENGKFTVASAEGYKLSDSTSNMVSKMGLNNWTTATEKLSGATTLAQMGFKDGADLNLFLDGAVMNVLSFDANQTVDDIIFGLAAYGIDASVNADGQFTATSKSHTFIMSGGLGSYLTKGTGGYVNSDTAYESYKPLVESKDYVETASKGLDYKDIMTEGSTLESLGFAQGGTVRVMLDGKTPYTLQFLATDKVQDVIYALSAYGINAEVKDGRFVAESVNNTFTLTGNLGSYFVEGGAYQNEVTGYESKPLTYETTEKLTNDTKLSDLGITRGDINVIKDGKVADTIHISDDTTIGQLFSAIKPYGMTGEIVTKANGDTSIRISADSDIKLADGTSNVVSGLGLQNVRKGDFEGMKKYWDDDATSGLITEDTLLSTLDRNGFIAQGSLIFNTGEGDDAVQHIINISANETVGSLLKKFNDSGIKATLDDGVIKLTGGLDKLTFTGGTSGLVETIGLDIHNIDKYASSSSALTYEGETHYSASNFANASTKLDIVNATDGNMSIFVDGVKCNIEVKSSDSFADLFKKIKDTVKARTGLDIQAGFKTKDGSISANPTDANNTGIIGLEIEKGHELVVGASNDTTNFATIANLNKTDYNAVTGSRALYRVNVNSLITESGLYRDGDITEGTFKIGDAEFTIDSTTTLASLINQINKNDKAYASAYWDTLAGTLVIESTVTGASLINIEAGTSNFTDIMGFTKTKDGVSALVTDSQTLGQNAVVRINGTTVTSATNVITSDISKIKGLTINLKNVSAGETVTISVEQDKEAIYNAVSDTLDAYNSMMEALGKELADKKSLGGESILKLMRNNLKRLMTSSLTGAYVFKNLASVGISTGEASDKITTNVTSLLIDKDKFMDALNTDSDAVQDLLVGTKANPGIFLQANNIVENSINTDGYFSNMANTLTKSINNIEKKISKNNLAIENYRTKLETKFHNMELTISGLQSAYANILK